MLDSYCTSFNCFLVYSRRLFSASLKFLSWSSIKTSSVLMSVANFSLSSLFEQSRIETIFWFLVSACNCLFVCLRLNFYRFLFDGCLHLLFWFLGIISSETECINCFERTSFTWIVFFFISSYLADPYYHGCFLHFQWLLVVLLIHTTTVVFSTFSGFLLSCWSILPRLFSPLSVASSCRAVSYYRGCFLHF